MGQWLDLHIPSSLPPQHILLCPPPGSWSILFLWFLCWYINWILIPIFALSISLSSYFSFSNPLNKRKLKRGTAVLTPLFFVSLHTYKGVPKKLELSSGDQAPCGTGFPFYLSVLGTHLYQCTSWPCFERLHLASVNFFEDSFNTFAHLMMDDLWAHLPTLHWVFSSFWPKMAWPCAPPSLFSQPQGLVFFCFLGWT